MGKPEIHWPYMPGRPADRLEKDFAAEAIEALQWAGWYCRQVENQRRIKKGFSDWVCIRRGRVVFLEFKRRHGGRQSAEQVEFMEQVRAHGGEYTIAKDWPDLGALLGKG